MTKSEQIKVLEGECKAADALAGMIKAAFDGNIIDRPNIQAEIRQAAESWIALREQRVLGEEKENPMHIFN